VRRLLVLLGAAALPLGCAADPPPSPRVAEPVDVPPPAASSAPVDGPQESAAADAGKRGHGLTPEHVRSVFMRRGYGAIRRCYERALSGDASLKGEIKVTLTILPSGDVGRVDVTSTMGEELVACVSEQVGRLHFAEAGLPTSASFPLMFGVRAP